MFSDWSEVLEAAASVTARHADSRQYLILLLDALGLPSNEHTVSALLPHLNSHEGATDMPEHQQPPKTVSALESMALSMYYTDHTTAEITAATGLAADEITALVATQERQFDADEAASITTAPGPAGGPVEQLLAWAEAHPAASIRSKAARVRGDLAELTARRVAEDTQRQAELRVAQLNSELEQAQKALRTVKTGGRPTPARLSVSACVRSSTAELAAIRAWAHAKGLQAADRGNPAKSVLDAYDTAHRTNNLAEAN
ncbi:Lsr2 family protein [Streptomyces sp. ASQP_92]|uniref:Lsr2 family protein n=1 Tax=Streptomyces sp. ASQP_92 TaxID=2979116 RepID=UPI0021C1087C|nr:Lsr2 family protein [Streptomyces sp. ASQP_92]MCT9094182.1 Lsr2 family protein [Streptomyces sp. ASQP_92]